MNRRQIAQKVIDFEYSRINAPCQVQHNYQPVYMDKSSERYFKWNLNSILQGLNLSQNNNQILWVGMGKISLLEAFIYCLLSSTKVNNELSDNYFVKTKFCLYQLAEKHLSIKQQKELVQNLCYAQYTKSIAVYLNKNYGLQSQIKKIFQSYITPLNQPLLPIQEIKLFSLHFSFLQFQILNDNVAQINVNHKKYYIVSQKQCVFIIQKYQENNNRSKSNSPKSNKQIQFNQQSLKKNSMLNSKKDSNQRNYFEASTPKFVPKTDTLKKTSKQKRQKEVQVQLFDQRAQFEDKNKVPNSNRAQIKSRAKYIPFINFNKKKEKNQQKNLSLRNTIQMHISILRGYKDRSKSKLKRLSIVKSNEKSRQKDKSMKININLPFRQKVKPPKDSGRIPITSQPSISFLNNQSLLSFNNTPSNTYLRPERKKSPSQQQPNVKCFITQPKVAFTYFSP